MKLMYLFCFIAHGILCVSMITDDPKFAVMVGFLAILNLAFFIIEDIKSHIDKQSK